MLEPFLSDPISTREAVRLGVGYWCQAPVVICVVYVESVGSPKTSFPNSIVGFGGHSKIGN